MVSPGITMLVSFTKLFSYFLLFEIRTVAVKIVEVASNRTFAEIYSFRLPEAVGSIVTACFTVYA